jgi:hypothetical protein
MKNDIIHEVQGNDGWWTDHHHLTCTHSHTLPTYLAPPRLDPPRTHSHGEVRFHHNQERRTGEKETKVRSCLQVCCPILTPKPPIYSARTASGDRREHRRIGPGDNQGAPRGSRSLMATRSVRPTCGSTDSLWDLVVVCFLHAAVKWVLKAVAGAHVDWRQFGCVSGP